MNGVHGKLAARRGRVLSRSPHIESKTKISFTWAAERSPFDRLHGMSCAEIWATTLVKWRRCRHYDLARLRSETRTVLTEDSKCQALSGLLRTLVSFTI